MNFICQKFLLLLSVAVTMAIPFDPEMSGISSRKNMAPSVGIHDPLEERDSIALRQNQPGQQILDIIRFFGILKIINLYLKSIVVLGCINGPQSCIEGVYFYKILINFLFNCILFPNRGPGPPPGLICQTSNGVDIPINFNFNDTHVQNIRTATAMAMSNPSAQNVDTLFNLLKDLMDSNNNTSFLNGYQSVEQKHFVLPVSKVTQPQVISQHNFKVDNTDRTLIPSFMPLFPLHHPIVPYSHFQWPVYPKLLHRLNPDFV
jgi:hypothetical protein